MPHAQTEIMRRRLSVMQAGRKALTQYVNVSGDSSPVLIVKSSGGQADLKQAVERLIWVKRFTVAAPIDMGGQDEKKAKPVTEGGRIVDYQDVTIRGYLSTFNNITEADREGDYVERGAFKQTIGRFMKNPVLLVNHQISVASLAGRFVTMFEDEKGLYFEAELSNSPADFMRDTRFKVVEGALRTCSMGGLFHYKEDGRGIFKVDLWEGSLTPVPANPDAVFSVRSLTDQEMKRLAAETDHAGDSKATRANTEPNGRNQ